MKNLEELTFLINKSKQDIESIRDRLIARLASLAENLDREKMKLKTDENYRPNSLGIIQGASLSIDLLCANLYSETEHLKQLERALKTLSNQETNEAP